MIKFIVMLIQILLANGPVSHLEPEDHDPDCRTRIAYDGRVRAYAGLKAKGMSRCMLRMWTRLERHRDWKVVGIYQFPMGASSVI